MDEQAIKNDLKALFKDEGFQASNNLTKAFMVCDIFGAHRKTGENMDTGPVLNILKDGMEDSIENALMLFIMWASCYNGQSLEERLRVAKDNLERATGSSEPVVLN